jgi:hypothetical protein
MIVPTTIPNNNMAVKLTFNSKGNVREASKKVLGRFHPPKAKPLLSRASLPAAYKGAG